MLLRLLRNRQTKKPDVFSISCVLRVVLHVHPHAKVAKTRLFLACLPCCCCCTCCCWRRCAMPSEWLVQYFPFANSFHHTNASSHRYKTDHPWLVSTSSAGVKSLSLRLHHVDRGLQKKTTTSTSTNMIAAPPAHPN